MYISLVQENIISTPPTNGTILPGVTRKTVIDIASDHGYKVVNLATKWNLGSLHCSIYETLVVLLQWWYSLIIE